MSAGPGAFPHQHGDPRGLRERIEAQLRERLEEALEMAALELLVELRKREGRPAPADTPRDRADWQGLVEEVLVEVRRAFAAGLGSDDRAALEAAEQAGTDTRSRTLAGQVALARRLPDYWQRLDEHRRAHLARRLDAARPAGGWLRRLLGS